MADGAGARETGDSGWLLETEKVQERRRDRPLSRSEIVAAALRIIDGDGLEALTMRRLGDELGVRAMAMYRHVRDKNQLLDLVVEGVLRGFEYGPMTGDWRSDAAAIARGARVGIMRHRHAVMLLASRPWVGPAGLAGIDVTVGVFRRAGLDDRMSAFAQFALVNYVTGFCAWEAANVGAGSEDAAARAQALARYRDFVQTLPAERFPNLVAVAPVLVSGTLDERFEVGLGFVLDGIQAAIEPHRTPDGPASPKRERSSP